MISLGKTKGLRAETWLTIGDGFSINCSREWTGITMMIPDPVSLTLYIYTEKCVWVRTQTHGFILCWTWVQLYDLHWIPLVGWKICLKSDEIVIHFRNTTDVLSFSQTLPKHICLNAGQYADETHKQLAFYVHCIWQCCNVNYLETWLYHYYIISLDFLGFMYFRNLFGVILFN